MEKKKIIVFGSIILLLAIAMFFYPKNAGSTGGLVGPPPSIARTEFGCIGLKYDYYPKGCVDCGTQIYCIGIVTKEKHCYTYMQKQKIEVPACKNPETSDEVLSICPTCYQYAAFLAYNRENNLEKAISICAYDNFSGSESCSYEIIDYLRVKNDTNGIELVCDGLKDTTSKNLCYLKLAEEISERRVDEALNFCKTIKSGEVDRCYYAVGVYVGNFDKTKAAEICALIDNSSNFAESCKIMTQ
jgi:hypothetical protein